MPHLPVKLSRKRFEKITSYTEAASDGLVFLLNPVKECMDAVPIAKGVLGGIMWIAETCRQFESNKQEWERFAQYLLDLCSQLNKKLGDDPPAGMMSDFRKLQQSLASVAIHMIKLKERPSVMRFVQTREDPQQIVEFRQSLDEAMRTFTVLQMISMGKAIEKGVQHETKPDCATTSTRNSPRPMKRCPPPSPMFTGRRSIIDAMHAAFASEYTSRRVFVLHGLGGAGKSQITYKFVEESQRAKQTARFSQVLYIDASSEASIIADLQSVACAKHIGTTDQDALDWLCEQPEEWLLIFNNADVISFPLSKYFPSCSHGNILITSRNRETRTFASPRQSHLQISNMNPQDAMYLLLVASGIEDPTKRDEDSAVEIAKALGYLALAVIQAGAYISKTGCRLEDYSELYRKRRKGLLEEYLDSIHRVDDYKSTVYTTWKISFEQLSPAAQQFMQLCACLHFDGIPEAIFQNATENLDVSYKADGSPALDILRRFLDEFRSDDHSWDAIKFNRVLIQIQSYSLIDFDTSNRTYSIHPLVHDWSLTTQSDNHIMRNAARHLLASCVSDWKFTSNDYTWRRSLLLHVDAVLNHSEEVDTAVAEELGAIYCEAGRWKEAEFLEVSVMETRKRLLGDEHPETLRSIAWLAATYRDQCRWKEAEVLAVTLLERSQQLLGKEHPDTLQRTSGLAVIYQVQGRHKEAEALHVTVLESMKRLFGEEHPTTLISMSCLASAYQWQDRWKEAESLEMSILETRKRLLGEEHPYTLKTMLCLAAVLQCQGRWKEAEVLQLMAVEKRKKVLGLEHLDTVSSIGDLAVTFSRQGRLKEAEVLEVTVMDTRMKLLGEEHPDTLDSISNLATTYRDLGQLNEAEELGVIVLETRKRLLGMEHLCTVSSMGNLAFTYGKQGRLKEAEDLEVTVMETRKRVLGEENPETLTSVSYLAHTYRDQGRLKEAETLEMTALEKRKRLLGEAHPDTVASVDNLAEIFWRQGRLEEAMALMLKPKPNGKCWVDGRA